MRRLRILIASSAILAIGTSSFAGDFQDSVAKAARDAAGQQTEQRSGNRNPYLWPGAALFVAGMSLAVYGFLHTSGGEFVSGEVSKESKTGLGGAGLAVAADRADRHHRERDFLEVGERLDDECVDAALEQRLRLLAERCARVTRRRLRSVADA